MNIPLVKDVAALGAELGRIFWIRRNPTTFIAFIERCIGRLFGAAIGAELALVYSTTAAGPTCRGSGLGLAAFGAELARVTTVSAGTGPAVLGLGLRLGLTTITAELALVYRATSAGPASSRSLRCRLLRCASIATLVRIALRTTGIAALGRITHLLVNAIHHVSTLHTGHTHAHEAHHSTTLVARSSLHGSTGCTSQEGGSCIGVGQCLQIADVFFVFFAGFDTAYAEGYYFNATQIAPFLAQYFVELVANFFSMSRQSAVTHTLFVITPKATLRAPKSSLFSWPSISLRRYSFSTLLHTLV